MSALHSYDEDEAFSYGLPKAILIHYFREGLRRNKLNQEHNYFHYYWVAASDDALKRNFRYIASLEKHIEILLKKDILKCIKLEHLSTNLKWYTLPKEFKSDEDDLFDINIPANPLKPKTPKKSQSVSLPKNFHITEELRAEARVKNWVDPDKELVKFKNHALQTDRKCVRWEFAFKNWLIKATEYKNNAGNTNNGLSGRNDPKEGQRFITDKFIRSELGEEMHDEDCDVVSYDFWECIR